jgi:hypothetical protein
MKAGGKCPPGKAMDKKDGKKGAKSLPPWLKKK